MQVRLANRADTEAIEALLNRCYPVLMKTAYDDTVLASALPVMTKANPELIDAQTFYVVALDGVLVGCGGWSPETPGRGSVVEGLAHIRHFAVDPDHNKKGIGKMIFQQSARAASASGATRLQAFSSLNAEPFYYRMGLRRIELMDISMGDGVRFPISFMEGPATPPDN